jgi:hypothetical protein
MRTNQNYNKPDACGVFSINGSWLLTVYPRQNLHLLGYNVWEQSESQPFQSNTASIFKVKEYAKQ